MQNFSPKTILIKLTDTVVSILIAFSILALVVFMGHQVLEVVSDIISLTFAHTVHDLAFIIVLIKIYKILTSYLNKHHLSIRYILEVAIIAPIIEIIFVSDEKSLQITIVYALFSIACLYIYFHFYDRIKQINQ